MPTKKNTPTAAQTQERKASSVSSQTASPKVSSLKKPSAETLNAKRKRLAKVLAALHKEYPNPRIALEYSSALELLIATMLSAQCTDERVNKVTAVLFKKYRSPQDYINVPQEILEQDIFSTGFYKAKAKNIQACCRALIEKFGGEVPSTLEELTSLAGVGRKTANVVLSHWFNTPGVVVDTHVTRLTNRMKFCEGEDAVKLEFELMEYMPKEDWRDFTHLMIAHGRAVCIARRPQCANCVLAAEQLCPFPAEQK